MRQLYIFDYDGVIGDSLDAWIKSLEKIDDKFGYGYKMTKENVNQLEFVTMDGLLAKSGRTRENSGDYLKELYKEIDIESLKVSFFAGIGNVLNNISEQGNIVCVNTANKKRIVEKKLEDENVSEYVSEVLGGDVPGSKSEKIIYLMEKYRFSPEKTWMVGDTMGDIIEGKKACVGTIAVTYGWHSYENMLGTEPDYIFRTVAELDEFLSVRV